MAHYARAGVDIEYNFPFGWNELEGIHDRGDWDLSNHAKHSGEELSFIPHIIETSAGADRSALAFLVESYREEEKRVYLNLAPVLTPYKVAVFPLLANKSQLVEKAREVYKMLKISDVKSQMSNVFTVLGTIEETLVKVIIPKMKSVRRSVSLLIFKHWKTIPLPSATAT